VGAQEGLVAQAPAGGRAGTLALALACARPPPEGSMTCRRIRRTWQELAKDRCGSD